ncbi:hypothetical protein J6590_061424 [Homalodisca vitripennis]|nr:hypothetical protein J6590_061424 [Homalodisca vitripennis]
MTRWWCVRLCNKTSPTSPVQCEVVFTRKEQEPIKSKSGEYRPCSTRAMWNPLSAPPRLLDCANRDQTVDKYSARFFTSINPCNIGFIFDYRYWCCLYHTGEDGDRITFANNNNEALTGDEQTGNCTLVPVRESFLFGPFPPVCYRQCALALNWIVVLWKVGVTGVSLPKLGTYQGPGQALSHHPLQPNSATPV